MISNRYSMQEWNKIHTAHRHHVQESWANHPWRGRREGIAVNWTGRAAWGDVMLHTVYWTSPNNLFKFYCLANGWYDNVVVDQCPEELIYWWQLFFQARGHCMQAMELYRKAFKLAPSLEKCTWPRCGRCDNLISQVWLLNNPGVMCHLADLTC